MDEQNELLIDVRNRFLRARKQLLFDEVVTAKEFADKVGILQQNIYKIKSGQRFPTLESIVRMCFEFNINPTWVIMGEGDMKIGSGSIDLIKRLEGLENTVKKIQRLDKTKKAGKI